MEVLQHLEASNRDIESLSLYDYDFPEAQIALEPAKPRDHALLWVMERHRRGIKPYRFRLLPQFLSPGDCLVLNNVKVLPVRLQARRRGEGLSEILLTSLGGGEVITAQSGLIAPGEGRLFQALISRGRKIRSGTILRIGENFSAEVLQRVASPNDETEGEWIIRVTLTHGNTPKNLFSLCGEMPLPPYIRKRIGERRTIDDRETYQSVFAASEGGAIAAPTAGLHFTPALLQEISAMGGVVVPLTLYVSFGTFRPIRNEDLQGHRLHREFYEIPASTTAALQRAKAAGKKVIGVGTTVARALEAAARDHDLLRRQEAVSASTDLFIRSGFRFQVIDRLVTNFHQPRSSLLVLASTFAGREPLLANYAEAITGGCRLFSYGDAMLIG